MRLTFQLCFALCAGSLALAVHAQETPAQEGASPKVVKIKARVNPGDLEYRWVFDDQKLLQKYLPERERMVDFSWRITFTELTLPEQDAWAPQDWAVALVGAGFEQTVPVARGGYFLLPAVPLGRQSATIMFHEQTVEGNIGAAWRVRVGADRRLSYAGFKQALDEVHDVQRAIPIEREGLRQVRASHYNALKACFAAAGGEVRVDGAPVAVTPAGHCAVLAFDPAKAAAGHAIEFAGPLDAVTVVDSADYLHYLDVPALRVTQATAGGRNAGGLAEGSANVAATNLSNLSYDWNFKRQQRLQGGLAAPAHLVDFVWRVTFEDLSEAQQDAWLPQGWTLALAGQDSARAVPVARGGYFLLPPPVPGQPDETLVFKAQGKRNVIGAAWVVHLHDGVRPYLHYGEMGEAMRAVRKAQDTIAEGNAELAALRARHYDGLKACFIETGGVVVVGDARTADASVGNCRILKFDPAHDAGQTIEFIGRLDAVTMVDTAPYLQGKR